MRTCLLCDEPIVGPWAFRLRVGGISHFDELHGAQFVQEPCDHFRDYSKAKYLCRKCAEHSGLYIGQLELDACRVPQGTLVCKGDFETEESETSSAVIEIGWGQFCPSDKGPGELFVPTHVAHAHFDCVCDGYGIPLWSIEPKDSL